MNDSDTEIGRGAGGAFPDTSLSALRAAASADSRESRDGWSRVVESYWRPVYKYIRLRWRASNEDAKDLAQTFFARAIEKQFFAGYDPARARFSTFVRTCVDHFLANEAQAAQRLKRGGGMRRVEEFDEPAADDFFHREWERAVFAAALDELRTTLPPLRWSIFEAYDLGEGPGQPGYREIAARFGVKESDVTNHLAAARRELRRALTRRGYGVPL